MGTVSRRTLLVASILASLALHGVLIAVSPKVPLLARSESPESLLQSFRVRLIDDAELQQIESGDEGTGSLSTRPGSITDTPMDDPEPLVPDSSLLEQTVPVPQLSERLAAESTPSEGSAAPDADLLNELDAKIIEISQNVARQDIEVTRRLVAPSSTRVIEEGELPTVRGAGATEPEQALLIDPLAPQSVFPMPGTGGGSAGGSGEPGLTAPPPWESMDEMPAPEEDLPALPELPIEKVMAREPVTQAIERNRDFDFIDDLVTMEVDAFVPPGEREGYFRLRIVPKEGESIAPLPKDVTFIIDASNSILQRKLDQTVAGVRDCIAGLRPEDRFNVVIFRDTPTLFRPSLSYATDEEKNAAREFLTNVESRGETDVYKGILPVIAEPPRPGVPGIALVLSDGKPTTGIKDGRTLINALTEENRQDYSIYAFAGGRTINQHMLDLLAYRNRGEASFTPQLEAIGSELPRFFANLNDPILVSCAANFGGIDETSVYPKQIPDFYRGQAFTVYGRFDPVRDREFAVRLTGNAGDDKKEVIFRADLAEAEHGDRDIARNWAFRKIYYLIGEMTRVGETPELLAELRGLAREYNIRTSYDE